MTGSNVINVLKGEGGGLWGLCTPGAKAFLLVTDNRRSRLDSPFCVITQHRQFEFGHHHHRQSKKISNAQELTMQLSQTIVCYSTNTEDAQEDWGVVCGPSCNPETNDRGLKLLDLATYNNLVLANTLGNHKPSRRWTWHSPDGTYHNQIYYILVKKQFRSGIKTARTRTLPCVDVGNDHDMVMTFQTRLNNSRKPTQP